MEDEQLRRKRHQAKLLQRRNTLIRGTVPSFTDELSESSEELLTRRVCIEYFTFLSSGRVSLFSINICIRLYRYKIIQIYNLF